MATPHEITGRRSLGLLLAMVSAGSWGWLPIGLKVLLDQLDGWTVAWVRFTGAALTLWLTLSLRRKLPRRSQVTRRVGKLLLLACLGLSGNYLGWVTGLRYISPATAGLVTQLSPLFLAAAAALVFRERIGRLQAAGFGLLLLGLVIFCHDQVGLLVTSLRSYGLGVALVGLGAFSWVGYALAQKELLKGLDSPVTVMLIYTGSSLCLLGGADLPALGSLNTLGYVLLAAATANTLVAYGCLSEAFRHCEASRIGAVLPLQPLFTFVFMHFATLLWPGFLEPEHLSLPTVIGAAAVMAGAAMAALGKD